MLTRRHLLSSAAGLAASLLVRTSRAAVKRKRFAVVGRGPMGAAAARHLSAAAEDVVVVGPEEPSDWAKHEGAFASHYDAGRQLELAGSEKVLCQLAQRSLQGFRDVEQATGVSFLRSHPNLQVAPRSRIDGWEEVRSVARSLGVETLVLDDAGLAERFPRLRFPPGSLGLLEPAGGIIDPRKMVKAQLRAAQMNGASVLNDEVVALRRKAGEVELVTRSGTSVRADRVLLATGAFTNAARLLERRLALQLHGVTAVLIEAPGEPRPDFPTVTCRFGRDEGGEVCFAMPPLEYPDGRWYIKGATASSVVTTIESDAAIGPWFRGKGVAEDPAIVVRLLGRILPGFRPGRVDAIPCMVAYTPSGNPYIDRIDERVGLAVGGNAWGVMTSDEIGRLAAAMMRDAAWSGPLGVEMFRAHFA